MLKNVSAFLLGFLVVTGIAYAGPGLQKLKQIFTGGVQIGATGTPIQDSFATTATIDLADTAAATCTIGAAVTLTGAAVGDTCTIGPNATAGALQGSWTCFASAADAVKPVFCNPTVGAINPASGSFSFRVFDP